MLRDFLQMCEMGSDSRIQDVLGIMKTLKMSSAGSLILAATLFFFACVERAACQQESNLRTPQPPETPQLHGPKVYGVRPGHPLLYRIPCTGKRPIEFSATHLPPSLKLDRYSGIITGNAPEAAGTYAVTFQASNALGTGRRRFKIVVGEWIGLTPQMGWNDWYTHYDHVSDHDIRAAAAAMIASGMADYGYQYVDIDDAWARKPGSSETDLEGPPRDEHGNILPNNRFPDMPALTEYIHSLGLKAGIYSSPGPLTCAKFEGSYQHESADAHRFADWGFDLLKYDWCSYTEVAGGKSQVDLEEPYKKISGTLKTLNRDVTLNICQYGMGEVWKWGRQVRGNSWRTTGDLGLTRKTSLPAFYSVGMFNAGLGEFAGPGGWNDPDYILIGTVGDANNMESPARQTSLTHEEQYSYMSMWSLMAAPLFFSGDMSKLDAFTLNVLCSPEVIDIDQDPLGKAGTIVKKTDEEFILNKPLDDGSFAVGLFNLTSVPRHMTADWKLLGLTESHIVRDVWRERDLGSFARRFPAEVPAHGVILVRIASKKIQHRAQ